MESVDWKEDPVIEEIRIIRQAIHKETKGLTAEERANWYNAQAEKALKEFDEARQSSDRASSSQSEPS